MLTQPQFKILSYLCDHPYTSQRALAKALTLSVGSVNTLLKGCRQMEWIAPDYTLTPAGNHALEPYKVKNAIILAAGFSSRCAPLSYEKPKGLFKVKGEVLIERQIRQLQEAGIQDIYVVVGYMKELFFYLEEKFGVHIIVNDEYMQRNNLSSVYAAKEFFGNSYICYSDNYIQESGYTKYAYQSYYAALYSEEYTDEYIMAVDKNGLIHQYYQGGEKCWYQMGEMYFSHDTAQKFLSLLEREYHYPSIYDMKIDDFYARHLSELPIYIKKYPQDAVLEFDTIAEIEQFDNKFIQNMGENILTNICTALRCNDSDITDIHQIKRGMTNTIFSFTVGNTKYIYRHPGRGTEKIIDRSREARAQEVAQTLGLDPTLIKCEPSKGWKLSSYIENVPFDYTNLDDERRGIELIRRLHSNPTTLGWSFDMLERAVDMQAIVSSDYYDAYSQFSALREMISQLYAFTKQDGYQLEMCHNDACDSNILLGKNGTYLIDWEYAGDNDPAADIGSFIVGCEHTREDCDRILKLYFGRDLTEKEKRHYYAYIAINGYFLFSWAIYKESTGQNLGNFTYMWYQYALKYGKIALQLYKGGC